MGSLPGDGVAILRAPGGGLHSAAYPAVGDVGLGGWLGGEASTPRAPGGGLCAAACPAAGGTDLGSTRGWSAAN
jgi:hypothetical protein